MQHDHQHFMQHALALAEQGECTVSPNPMVGCVIVKNGKIIAQAYHQRAGEAHAEILALREAGKNARGATLYVTLEPCCHFGRTPPCVASIVAEGITKVVVACKDPNPRVAGQGLQALREAGIAVDLGVCEAQARMLNRRFFHYITHKRPFVISKWAISLDGKTAVTPGDEPQLSCEASLRHMHKLRQSVDAILIGAQTALRDNPLLTVRYHDEYAQPRHPIRIILSSQTELPIRLRVFDPRLPGRTVLVTTAMTSAEWRDALSHQGVEVLLLSASASGGIELSSLLTLLGEREITCLLVEGGMQVHHSFLAAGLIDEVQVCVTPLLIGNLPHKQKVSPLQIQQVGDDFIMHTRLEQEGSHV